MNAGVVAERTKEEKIDKRRGGNCENYQSSAFQLVVGGEKVRRRKREKESQQFDRDCSVMIDQDRERRLRLFIVPRPSYYVYCWCSTM